MNKRLTCLTAAITCACMAVALFADGPSARLTSSQGDQQMGLESDWIPAQEVTGYEVNGSGADDASPRGPGADNCADATAAVDGANAFSTLAATPDGPSHTAGQCQYAGTLNNNVWFSYTATCTGVMIATTCEQLGGSADYDTRVAIYSGTCGSLNLLGCNDDDPTNNCGTAGGGYKSTAQAAVTQGNTYLISVGGYDASEVGTGSLFIQCGGGGGGCTTEIYANGAGGTLGALNISPGRTIGQGVNTIPGDWTICRVQALVGSNVTPVDTPFDVRLKIWDSCPTVNSDPVTPCDGVASGANLLYESLSDAPLLTTAGLTLQLMTWTIPDLDVGSNQVWLTFEGTLTPVGTTATFILGDNSAATTGSVLGAPNYPGGYTLCSATASGCNRYQSTVGGVGVTQIGFFIDGNPIAGGAGACCVDGTCVDGQDLEECGALGGIYQGSGTLCSSTNCPPPAPSCSGIGFGQPLEPGVGQGPGGIIAGVSDINPNYANFTAAENITPAVNGTITKLRWWGLTLGVGGGFPPCNPQLGDSPDDFTITVWNDALDLPFQIVAGPFVQGTHFSLTETDTGFVFAGRNYAVYEATGLNIPVEADLCYWIEIVNHLTGQCTWLWATGPEGDGLSVTGANNLYEQGDQNDYDLSLCVDIEINSDGCLSAIELPGACCLNLGTACDDSQGISTCVEQGGYFFGVGTLCSGVSCQGACCNPEAGTCSLAIQQTCEDTGRIFQGVATSCTPNPCSGACCLSDGFCLDGVDKQTCELGFNGSFWGGQSCATTLCASNEICDPSITDVLQLSCGESLTVNNRAQANATTPPIGPQPDLSCFGGGASNGVGAFWMSFVGTGGEVEINTCSSTPADTILAVYTNPAKTCDQFDETDEIACSEDDGSEDGFCPDPLQSRVCVQTVNGQVYYVQVTSFNALSVGLITVNMICPCQVPAPQCTCPGDVNGDNSRNGADIQAFVNCLLGTGTECACADADENGSVQEADIATFVGLLLNNTGACP